MWFSIAGNMVACPSPIAAVAIHNAIQAERPEAWFPRQFDNPENVEENQDGVVLLDGLEYLISNNDFNKVLRVIDQVNDHISQSKSLMIVPVDPRAFSQKELALLERNTEKLGTTRRAP